MNILTKGARKLRIVLDRGQLEQFETYYRVLVEWNRGINLTAITGYEEVQLKHFLDSLTVVPHLEAVHDEMRMIDVGTGAGFPGVPLKIAFPDIKLTLLEATIKKTRFLKHLIEELGLSGVETLSGRAEEIAHESKYREQYDLVLSRAVAALPELAELTLPFCVINGLFIAQKKGNIEKEIRQSVKAISALGGELREVSPVDIKGLNNGRKLVIIDKIIRTPDEYPRHPGVPRKRPIT